MESQELELVLKSVEKDLVFLREPLFEVSKDMKTDGFTENPIFILHQEKSELGESLFHVDEYEITWNVRAATMEELVEKEVIQADRKEMLTASYNSDQSACILLLAGAYSRFLFFPFKPSKATK